MSELHKAVDKSLHYSSIVTGNEYCKLRKELSDNPKIVNDSVCLQRTQMTGLEYSVFSCNIVLACIYIAAGADPTKNTFKGWLSTNEMLLPGDGEAFILRGFRNLFTNVEGKKVTTTVIPGFAGLYAILSKDDYDGTIDEDYRYEEEICFRRIDDDDNEADRMRDFLSIIELCIDNNNSQQGIKADGDISTLFPEIRTKLDNICWDFVPRLVEIVYNTLFLCSTKGLVKEITMKITKYVILDAIWTFFTDEVVSYACNNSSQKNPTNDV